MLHLQDLCIQSKHYCISRDGEPIDSDIPEAGHSYGFHHLPGRTHLVATWLSPEGAMFPILCTSIRVASV